MKLSLTFFTALQASLTGFNKDLRYAEYPQDSYKLNQASYRYNGHIQKINENTYLIDNAIQYSYGVSSQARQNIESDLNYISYVGYAGAVISFLSTIGFGINSAKCYDPCFWASTVSGIVTASFTFNALDSSKEKNNWNKISEIAQLRKQHSDDITGLLQNKNTLVGTIYSRDELPDIFENNVNKLILQYQQLAPYNPKASVETCVTLPFSKDIVSQVTDQQLVLTNNNPDKSSQRNVESSIKHYGILMEKYEEALQIHRNDVKDVDHRDSTRRELIEGYEQATKIAFTFAEKTSYALSELNLVEINELRLMLESKISRNSQVTRYNEIIKMLDDRASYYKEIPFNKEQIDTLKHILRRNHELLRKIKNVEPNSVEKMNDAMISTTKHVNSMWYKAEIKRVNNAHDKRISELKPLCDNVITAYKN